MKILGIETSCDETSVAVVEDGVRVLSNVIASSKDAFEKSAGVIPEQAARQQVECMIPVLDQALKEAKLTHAEIDVIAVTKGPGLLGSLLVGTTTARTIAELWKKPLIGVHHTLGHLSSTWLGVESEPVFPILTLSVSGGHTDLWYRESHTRGKLVGRTRDDAAGEAFDKGASLLGLPYPGGPAIAKLAEDGDEKAFAFPLPLEREKTLDFSFSGLKTSLKYLLRDNEHAKREDVTASYQHAICAHLCDKLGSALREFPDTKEVHLVGGVSANARLRVMVGRLCAEQTSKPTLRFPLHIRYCTDNAAMIAAAGYFLVREKPEYGSQGFETTASIPLERTVS